MVWDAQTEVSRVIRATRCCPHALLGYAHNGRRQSTVLFVSEGTIRSGASPLAAHARNQEEAGECVDLVNSRPLIAARFRSTPIVSSGGTAANAKTDSGRRDDDVRICLVRAHLVNIAVDIYSGLPGSSAIH